MGCFHPKKIADYQAGRLDGAAHAKVTQHLKECSSCRTVHLRAENALLALREIGEGGLPVPALSSARIEATLRWTRGHQRYNPRSVFGFGFGLAAAAACAVVMFAWHPWRKTHSASPAIVAVAPVQSPSVAAPRVASLSALVTLVGGDAHLGHGDATPIAVDARLPLAAGDVLTTAGDGRIGFQWGEGSGALVGAKSRLTLAQLEPLAQGFELSRGQVSVRVGPHQPGEALHVLTPGHNVIVHGTWFVVAADVRGTTISVLEGVVEVTSREGDGSSTKIAAPQRAFFANGQGMAATAHPLSGREAAALRLANEIGLATSWTSFDHVRDTTGLLAVTSTPAAQLVVDGVPFGSTSLGLRRLRGRHLVELSRPGFATVSRWVNVGSEPGELRLALPREIEAPTVTAPEETEVQQVIQSRQKHITACYEHSLKRNPQLTGTATLAIKIGPEGQVLGTSVENNNFTDPEVTDCLRRQAAGLVFHYARNATVLYPFSFRTQ